MTTAFPDCPECGATGLGASAMLGHRWRRHTEGMYRETFGRALLGGDPVKWDQLRPSEIVAAVEQRRRTLDIVHAW